MLETILQLSLLYLRYFIYLSVALNLHRQNNEVNHEQAMVLRIFNTA